MESLIIHESEIIKKKQTRTTKNIKKAFLMYASEVLKNKTINDYVNINQLYKTLKESFEREYKCKIGLFSVIRIVNDLL